MSGQQQDSTIPWIAIDQPQIAPSPSPAQVVQAPVVTPSASATTAAASRKRGCNCKKSGCLKLYCECFAANMRCGERCQCMGCKNKEHNRLEIAHAIQAIEKRTQKAFRSPATVARKLEHFRNTPVLTVNPLAPPAAAPVLPSSSLILGAAPLTASGDHTSAHHAHSYHHHTQREENQSERDRAVTAILERNPLAFQPKVANGSSQHLRGCNCRKSGCMKNYCECHQAGVPCTSRCACHQCRNTEMFVSAKKMLVFKGPDDGTSMDGGKLGLDHQHRQRAKSSSSSATTKRGYRKSSFDSPPQQHQLVPHVYTPARAQNPAAALELLSRSAPAAPRPTSFLRATTPSKRAHAADASPYQLHHTIERPFVPSSHATIAAAAANNFTKRKYSKVSSRPLFMDRIQEAAAGASSEDNAALPSVEKTIEQEFGSGDGTAGEPSLAMLCRSLLRAAMTVESTGAGQDSDHDGEVQARNDKSGNSVTIDKPQRKSMDEVDGDVCMSPVTDDLLCAEDIETPGDKNGVSSSQEEDGQQSSSVDGDNDNSSTRQTAMDLNLVAVAQERAVLQEVSAWLRNITTAALPNSNGSSSRQF